jgi:exodeoxyribonuclease VII large subunit
MRQPLDLVRQAMQRLDDLLDRARASVLDRRRASGDRLANLVRRLERTGVPAPEARRKLDTLSGKLDALNPMKVLERGYSIVSRAQSGRVVTREKQVQVGSQLRIQLHEGEIRAAVIPRGEDLLDGVL